MAALQQQARQQAVSLSNDLRATSHQPDAVQQNIRQLEAQQDNSKLVLPASTPPDAPADNMPAAVSAPQPARSSQDGPSH